MLPSRPALVRKAAIIALCGNLVLALLKIVTGLATGSLAVLGDGIDSSTDVAIAVMTLAVGFIINQPSDKEHPWGHHRAETIATIVLAFIIMFAGFQLFQSSLEKIHSGASSPLPSPIAIAVTCVSIVGKLLLALSQYRLGKKSGSSMIIANAKNMTNDIIISGSVLVGLGASLIFKIPIIDAITALAVRMTEARQRELATLITREVEPLLPPGLALVPAMASAQRTPCAEATCANKSFPVTSPIAHTPGMLVAIRSSTWI